MAAMIQNLYNATFEKNLVPDAVVRRLRRVPFTRCLREGYLPSADLQLSQLLELKKSLEDMPIAPDADKTKSQLYEIPISFFKLLLGKNLKFSCCYFKDSTSTLDDAEVAMFDLYCERAQIKDGQSILDIGCGWGCLCFYIAKKYKNCKITGITFSETHKSYIEEYCREHQLLNIDIIAADISKHEMDASFDRIIAVEVFEHLKNYKALLNKISKWMKPESLLFVHHICHKTIAYHIEDINDDEWFTTNFFSSGTFLSSDLLLYFQDDVSVVNHWLISGMHYSKTSEEWLKKMDRHSDATRPLLESTYGKESATKWTAYWRTFLISITEQFGYNKGNEWMVSHYLFKKK